MSTLPAEVIAKCKAAGMLPSAIDTDISEAFEAGQFIEMSFDKWLAEKYRPTHAHAFISEQMADLETLAFGERNMTARAKLVTELGPDQANARAQEWGLTGFDDFKTKGKRPFGTEQSQDDKSGSKNPWRGESFNLTEQMRIFRTDPKLAERLAKAAGSSIGGTRPKVA